MASKKILRQVYLEKRLTLTQGEYQNRNEKLIENIHRHLPLSKVSIIHTFLAITRQKEVDTFSIIESLKRKHSNLQFAVSKTIPPRSLQHFHLTDKTEIAVNSWGIPEPKTGEHADLLEFDMVFVPLISFDKEGHRIGYGGGYYDRFLAEVRPEALKVGLSLSPSLDHISYREEFDIPLDMCLTPFEFFDFTRR